MKKNEIKVRFEKEFTVGIVDEADILPITKFDSGTLALKIPHTQVTIFLDELPVITAEAGGQVEYHTKTMTITIWNGKVSVHIHKFSNIN